MYFGLAYYPEHWPEERWPVDAKMMQEAQSTACGWANLPGASSNRARASTTLTGSTAQSNCWEARHQNHDVHLLAHPPPWVFQKYPEIRNVRADGKESNYGHRYTFAITTPPSSNLAQQIDRKFIEHYAGNPNVMAWHIDNEIGSGNTCYCEICHKRFIEYLCEKYGTVENLNEKWGTHFWSFAFSSLMKCRCRLVFPCLIPAWR
jgi:beta-galactosidase